MSLIFEFMSDCIVITLSIQYMLNDDVAKDVDTRNIMYYLISNKP